jgi:catechol 2,3-dioxygenase-like lactoylglutathione lyase family enzyme
MRLFVRALVCASLICAVSGAPAAAQTPVLQILDHIHLNVPDPAKGVEWYQKNFGGAPMTEAPDRLMFGDTRLIFLRNDKGQPSTGSALDHLGFSFADLDAKMKELEAAGVKVVTPVRDVAGLFKLGFVEDPWGTRIEVVQDPDTLGLHHVHLRGPDPAAVLAWYKEKFGGEVGKLKED